MAFTNSELRQIITDHFAKDNKRMTNISKISKHELLDIINKYSIELPEPKKKEKKKVENINTTDNPFKLGEFEYTYEWDDDNGCYGGCYSTFKYKITKITKCFITIVYYEFNGGVDHRHEQKCKIKFSDYTGWFFEYGNFKRRIPFKKDQKTIQELEYELQYNRALYLTKGVWMKYH